MRDQVFRLLMTVVTISISMGKESVAQTCPPDKVWDERFSKRDLAPRQITVEVRFISVSDSFLDRIGLDLNFDPDEAPCDPEFNGTGDSFPKGETPTPLPNPFGQTNLLMLPAHAGTTFGLFQLNGAMELDDFMKSVFAEPDEQVYRFDSQVISGDVRSIDSPMNAPLLFGQWKSPGISLTVKASATSDQEHVWLSLQPIFHGIIPSDTFSPVAGGMVTEPGDINIEPPINPQVTAKACTSVTVPDGSTLVIGGLLRQPTQTDRLSQILANVPALSGLFQNVGLVESDRQVLLTVTANIGRSGDDQDTGSADPVSALKSGRRFSTR